MKPSVEELMSTLGRLGIAVQLERGEVVLEGDVNKINGEILATLRERKAAIVAHLKQKHALYVATDLEWWTTDEPHIWADRVIIAGKPFVRLTPSVLAWLRGQVAKAEAACAKGALSLDQFGAIIDAFCPVYEFAVRAGMARGASSRQPGEISTLTGKVPPCPERC